MSESFDNQLFNKIRGTFENYNEPFNEEAWLLMKQKLTNKKKKKFILLFNIAKAASVIFIIGFLGLYFYNSGNRTLTGKKIESVTERNNKNRSVGKNFNVIHDKEKYLTGNKKYFKENKDHTNSILPENNKNENVVIIDIDSLKNIDKEDNGYANVLNDYMNDTSTVKILKDTVYENRTILLPEEDFVIHKTNKKFNIGIALTSYYTSSDIGAKDNISIGGGIQTEFALTDFISINSGILLADHRLDTENGSLLSEFQAFKTDATNDAYAGNISKEVYLIGLDIPLNMSFNFNRFTVTSGVSSLVYLKESYSENYYVENAREVYNNNTGEFETVNLFDLVNHSDSKGAFQTFDFAKLLNLSVGYSVHIKKGKLIFEPFAKIPLGNLTGYDISYGYGGVLLRYEF